MKRTRYAVLALLLLFSSAMLLRASLPQVATGTWAPGAAMSEARTGAATASLPSGQVLMTGGTTAGGGITNSAEVFDPASNSWSGLAAVMQDARSGHTASALADGRVLLAGGENSGGVMGTLEIYDPAADSFSSVGSMLAARKNHGAAMLPDGRVWLVGGSDGTNALASSEIYDPADGTVTAGPNLPQARSGLSATTLLDGTVLIAGGSNADQGDLASTLIYDPTAGSFTPGASLSAARSGHTAILLPLNNSVLIAGGSAAGSELASAELYVPWTGAAQATADMGAARSGAAGSGFKDHDGRAMVAGGSGLASSEYYGFATVKTDKDDYAPGEYANVSGSGWQAGETVTLTFHEVVDPPFHPDGVRTVVADVFGNISNSDYLLEDHDNGVRYYLTAVGADSQARTTFTDASLDSSISFTTNLSTGPITVAAGSTLNWSFTATCVNGSGPTNTCANGGGGLTAGGPVSNGYLADIQESTTSGFSPAPSVTVRAAAQATSGGTGTASSSFTAPSTPGTYFYRTNHAQQNGLSNGASGTNSWGARLSNVITVTVTAACTSPSVTLNPTNQTVTYGAASVSFSAAASGTPAPTVQWQVSTNGGTTFSDIGGATSTTFSISNPTVAMSGNQYRAVFTNTCGGTQTATSTAATLTVTKKNLTISGAVADNKEYDGGTSATVNFAGASLVGVIAPDAVSIDSSGYSASFATKTVANGKAVTVLGVTLSGADAGNYTVSQPSGLTADITAKHITGSFTADNKVYDGNDSATVLTRSLSGAIGGDDVHLTGGTATFSDKNVADGKTVTLAGASLSGADAGNYVLDSVATTTANITPAHLTVTANNKAMILNGPLPAFTFVITGFVNSETSAVLSSQPSCTTTATGMVIGSFSITCSGGAAANYDFAYVNGTLTVSFAPAGACLAGPGHTILQPIELTGASLFPKKGGSTVPAKFRVCDAFGNSVGPTPVVLSFKLVGVAVGTLPAGIGEDPVSTTPDTAFRWDGEKWIFNISTKNLQAGYTYLFEITLIDNSKILFQFGIK